MFFEQRCVFRFYNCTDQKLCGSDVDHLSSVQVPLSLPSASQVLIGDVSLNQVNQSLQVKTACSAR